MSYIGDFPTGATIDFKWDTYAQAGESITRSTDGTLTIFKNNSTTQRTSLNGVTQTEDFDGNTGNHHIRIDTSDNTDAGFYAAGSEYFVVMVGMVIDTKTVNKTLFHFSIQRTGGVLALVLAGNLSANVVQWRGSTPNVLISGRVDSNMQAAANNVITSSVIATDAFGAAQIAADAIGSSELAATAANKVRDTILSDATTFAGANINATISSRAIPGDAMALTSAERNSTADAFLNRDMSVGTDSGSTTFRTPRQALRFLRNFWDIVAGVLTVRKEDDSTTSWTATVVGTPGSDPATSMDPAGP